MKECVVGIDLGGTKIEIALVEEPCAIIARERYLVDVAKGASGLIEEMIRKTSLLLQRSDRVAAACGIAVAGQVDAHAGTVLFAPNLRWHAVELKAMMEKGLGIKTIVLNDVRAAMLGEWLFGAGKGSSDCVSLFVGTGIGGGIVSSGALMQGHNHAAGELGHMVLDIKGPPCTCGNRGCLEALASGWAIAKAAKMEVAKDPAAGRLLLNCTGEEEMSTLHVSKAAKMGDPLASAILESALEALTAASISIVNIFNPDRLIFGGGVFFGQEEWLEKIDRGVRKGALSAATEKLKIVSAGLKGGAGMIGAAAAARGYPR